MKTCWCIIEACIYSTPTPSDRKYFALPYSPKCRTRLVQYKLMILCKSQPYLLFWSSTAAKQPILKFSGIRQWPFYYALRVYKGDIWIRKNSLCSIMSGSLLGRLQWVRLIQMSGLVSSEDIFTHRYGRLAQTEYLPVTSPSQQPKSSWNHYMAAQGYKSEWSRKWGRSFTAIMT